MRVLVVEDESLIAMLAVDLLEQAGHAVTLAGAAAPAIELARSGGFDVAVVDIGLPDATGAAVVRDLLAVQPRLRIVLSSGRLPDDPLVIAARHAGGANVRAQIGKPWPEGALVEAVERAASGPPPMAPAVARLVETLRCLA